MSDLEKAKQLLSDGSYTCVLCREDEVTTSVQRGVKPLVALIESGRDFCGCSAADKVVGRATAFLYVLLGVRAVYAAVISKAALEVLNANHITVESGTVSEYIVNRSGDGMCPFEAAVLETDTPQAAYEEIRRKMREMNIAI